MESWKVLHALRPKCRHSYLRRRARAGW
jgi:hypothetical protein